MAEDHIAEAQRLFKNINQKWEDWYKAKYWANDPKAPLVTPPADPTPQGLEKELWVKASLLADGLQFENSALEGVCDVYREQSRWLFDWNIGPPGDSGEVNLMMVGP